MAKHTRIRKFRAARPTRDQLNGYSPSEFKTLLKQNGFKVARNFWHNASVAIKNNRYYRFRWWNEDEFVFDESCKIPDFDRWGNSNVRTLPFYFHKDLRSRYAN
jgi:hypothetical protein